MSNVLLHGGEAPWIIAMDCAPNRAAVLDYAVRWAIEPMFSDFKGRRFELEDSQPEHAGRLERLILVMSLAMHWCVRVDRDDALDRPTPLEKNASLRQPRPLELQEAPSQPSVLVHPGPAPTEAVPAKRHPFASLSWGHGKLIGDEQSVGG